MCLETSFLAARLPEVWFFRSEDCSLVIECLPEMHKVLAFIPITERKGMTRLLCSHSVVMEMLSAKQRHLNSNVKSESVTQNLWEEKRFRILPEALETHHKNCYSDNYQEVEAG